MLCWLFTSSNRIVRDKATKSLTNVFLSQADLFPELALKFDDVDDVYVLERIVAAAFGAACIDQSSDRLRSYAEAAASLVFSKPVVLPALLLRDYARGIIELAASQAVLPDCVYIKSCRPPYGSPPPRLAVTEELLKQVAKDVGDETILRSCESFTGDFARYEIEPRVGSFTAVSLKKPRPASSRELFEQFEREVIEIDVRRIAAVKALRQAQSSNFCVRLVPFGARESEHVAEEVPTITGNVAEAEAAFLSLLNSDELKRFEAEASEYLGTGRSNRKAEILKIDLDKAKRWVAKRAYDLGWTNKLFQNDNSHYRNHSRERPTVERIGKKYQWIALDELLCRLADNYWMGGSYGDPTKPYNDPLDVGFKRDIDPTVFALSDQSDNAQGARPPWTAAGDVVLDTVSEERLAAWPFRADPAEDLEKLLVSTDADGESWLKLYEHRSATEKYETKPASLHGMRQQQFHFLMCILVNKKDCQRLADHLSAKNTINVMDWDPIEFTDGPYLREAPWRDTWSIEQWVQDDWTAPKGMKFAIPVCRYLWESHLDASLPDGSRALLPAPWLANVLELSPDKLDASAYVSQAGQIAFLGCRFREHGSSALISRDVLEPFLAAHGLTCFWLYVAERNAWPGGDNDDAARRRSEGVCWIDNGKVKVVKWRHDNANGTSKAALTDGASA